VTCGPLTGRAIRVTLVAMHSSRRNLAVVLGAAIAALAADLIAAGLSGSLALIADAAHRVTDVVGVAIALSAATIAARPPTARRTFGWARAEVIAACVNAGLLMGMGVFIGYEAILRLVSPEAPEPGPMAVAALIGLAGSGVAAIVLRESHEGFAARSAFLDVVGDAVGSIAALLAAGLLVLTGFAAADAIASLAVTLLVVPRSLFLLRDAVSVLMETTPAHIHLDAIRARLLAIPNVTDVHDLHAWQITAGLPMVTVHITCGPDADIHAVLDAADHALEGEFDIAHSTLQVEPAGHDLEPDAHA
jgi:cobalt-zinc-cadmium efflux system protein